ncbi:hypothetical protein M406DRAFT_45829 [Cryphonectria parasitica EP155]|uniref:Restriction of telomere capping protein 5 n=1 Tax=Cryphonectria parasitica (strain ATCC 38755 / EP155) TaxID=660469 RepID=A0A9P5CLE8_CRYP1|nr:uncharacterized protein M406DRAFT_45829 [Cryphonectria parasitica EP155]KAF3762152.1 hypothetical protein M406DRAFT_45829 [Cryphonectria parasitica EP155]
MGQTLSSSDDGKKWTHEELRRALAAKFLEKCFTPIESYSLKDNFKSLADVQQNTLYLSDDVLARFLEIPDVLHVSPVLFQMMSSVGAFPCQRDAPVILGFEEVVIAVTLLTARWARVLSKGVSARKKLLFKSMAVYDRAHDAVEDAAGEDDRTRKEEDDNDHKTTEHDDLVLSALDALHVDDAFKLGNKETIHGALIPADNFRRLITLLLLMAPVAPNERISRYPVEIESLLSVADSTLASFVNVERAPGINFKAFSRVMDLLPRMLDPLNTLFEHFLFSRNLDFTKHKNQNDRPAEASSEAEQPAAPLLPQAGSILNHATLSQLSFFIDGSTLFHRLRLLYSGDRDGFSMGSFESGVFNWRAPSILLVRGSRIHSSPGDSSSRFPASLPPRRFPDESTSDNVTFGLYVSQPWKESHKQCFGDTDTTLFQLEPIQDILAASSVNRDYVSFLRTGSSGANAGVGAGNPPPKASASHRTTNTTHLGSVSLLLDSSFEFGVFTHDLTMRGGAFQNSVLRKKDFQTYFEIESLEVWGCGGDEEAKRQAAEWAFEEREAEARRRINLGTGDIEADRALLELAGLVGGTNRSGGSMA